MGWDSRSTLPPPALPFPSHHGPGVPVASYPCSYFKLLNRLPYGCPVVASWWLGRGRVTQTSTVMR